MRIPIAIASLAMLLSTPLVAQEAALAARIRRVENGLLPPVVVAGRTDQGMPLAQRMRAFNVPAVSIAVINDGRVEWARAYGSLQAGGGAPADTATLFQAASLSKPVSVLGAMMLVGDRRLSLDADVNTFLRSWQVPRNAFTDRAPVTLRRIASHSAGLTVHGFAGYAAGAPIPTTVQVLDGQAPANSPPVHVDTLPGTLLRYSGGGTTVMQLMMEDVSGRPFAALMRESVLRPLGMMHSSYDFQLSPGDAARAARGHDGAGAPIPGGWHRHPEMAAAGLWTTPSDMARYLVAMQRAYRGDAGGPITPAQAREILTMQMAADSSRLSGFGLGLGMERAGTPAYNYGHGGANAGYRSQMLMFAGTGRGAVIMTNGNQGGDLIVEILRSLAREYDWPDFRPLEKPVVAMDPALLRDVTGRYLLLRGDSITLEFTAEGGRLVGHNPTWPAPRELHPMSTAPASFFVRESEREYTFERDASGRVVRLRTTGTGDELVAQRVD